jgi:hypothetical protein
MDPFFDFRGAEFPIGFDDRLFAVEPLRLETSPWSRKIRSKGVPSRRGPNRTADRKKCLEGKDDLLRMDAGVGKAPPTRSRIKG